MPHSPPSSSGRSNASDQTTANPASSMPNASNSTSAVDSSGSSHPQQPASGVSSSASSISSYHSAYPFLINGPPPLTFALPPANYPNILSEPSAAITTAAGSGNPQHVAESTESPPASRTISQSLPTVAVAPAQRPESSASPVSVSRPRSIIDHFRLRIPSSSGSNSHRNSSGHSSSLQDATQPQQPPIGGDSALIIDLNRSLESSPSRRRRRTNSDDSTTTANVPKRRSILSPVRNRLSQVRSLWNGGSSSSGSSEQPASSSSPSPSPVVAANSAPSGILVGENPSSANPAAAATPLRTSSTPSLNNQSTTAQAISPDPSIQLQHVNNSVNSARSRLRELLDSFPDRGASSSSNSSSTSLLNRPLSSNSVAAETDRTESASNANNRQSRFFPTNRSLASESEPLSTGRSSALSFAESLNRARQRPLASRLNDSVPLFSRPGSFGFVPTSSSESSSGLRSDNDILNPTSSAVRSLLSGSGSAPSLNATNIMSTPTGTTSAGSGSETGNRGSEGEIASAENQATVLAQLLAIAATATAYSLMSEDRNRPNRDRPEGIADMDGLFRGLRPRSTTSEESATESSDATETAETAGGSGGSEGSEGTGDTEGADGSNNNTTRRGNTSFENFLSELRSGLLAAQLSHRLQSATAAQPGDENGTFRRPVNFVRVFQLASNERRSESGVNMVPVLIVGVRSVNPNGEGESGPGPADEAAAQAAVDGANETMNGSTTEPATVSSSEEANSASAETSNDPSIPGAPEGQGNRRSWVVYVFGGNYPENHPLLRPSILSENPTYEDLLDLEALMGQVRPPVATAQEVENSGGLFTVGGEEFKLKEGEKAEEKNSEDQALAETLKSASKAMEGTRCLICLSDYEQGEECRYLKACSHSFHRACIDKWLTTGCNNCPMCRAECVKTKEIWR